MRSPAGISLLTASSLRWPSPSLAANDLQRSKNKLQPLADIFPDRLHGRLVVLALPLRLLQVEYHLATFQWFRQGFAVVPAVLCLFSLFFAVSAGRGICRRLFAGSCSARTLTGSNDLRGKQE
jgi:hypothetical protein